MSVSVIIIDDFYNNALEVRKFALSQEFNITGNWPGNRSQSFLTSDTKVAIEKLLFSHAGKVTDWHDQDGLTGSFQLTYSSNRSWIHTDDCNTWAGVLYLTPDPPLSGGTGLFRYKDNKACINTELTDSYDSQDMTKWELVDRIGNKFNRLILYRSNLFHSSLDYFGNSKETARLFQLFFLDTEN